MLMTCGAACRCRRRSEPAVAFIQSPQALGSPGVELDSVVGRSLAFIEIDIPTEESLGMLEHDCRILSEHD